MIVTSLPKVHYSWVIEWAAFTPAYETRWINYATTTHAICLNGIELTSDRLDYAVYLCNESNKISSEIISRIGIVWLPWEFIYYQGNPADIAYKLAHDYIPVPLAPYTVADHGAKTEIDTFTTFLTNLKTWLDIANAKYGCSIEIGAFLFDNECFDARVVIDQPAITAAHDAFTDLVAASDFFASKVYWFDFSVKFGETGLYSSFVGNEKVTALCPEFYRPQDQDDMLINYTRNITYGQSLSPQVTAIVPWVSIGQAWIGGVFQDCTTILPIADIQISGRNLNLESSYREVTDVVLYKNPYQAALMPQWETWFNAYVKGAQGTSESTRKHRRMSRILRGR